MPARVEVALNRPALEAFLQGPTGPVFRQVDTIARRTANEAKRRAPVREGTLRASINHLTTPGPGRVVGAVNVGTSYALYVMQGTGIYGPAHRVITPKHSRALRFTSGGVHGPLTATRGGRARGRKTLGAGGVVFARYVRGAPANPFLIEAFRLMCPYPVIENPIS